LIFKYDDLKLSELDSLIFPSSSACYSLIPKDLKEVRWEFFIVKVNFNEKFRKLLFYLLFVSFASFEGSKVSCFLRLLSSPEQKSIVSMHKLTTNTLEYT